MTNVGEVYFRLYGENFDPHEVTKFLGLEPSRVSIKAKPVPKFSSWVLSLSRTEEPVYDVYEKSEALLKLLLPKQELISKAKESFGLDAVLR
ncbi:DUF4279 domain-containing protein [Trichocoleus sp. FACHB-591]|uniref:DUF4279 domain-containing protein n=1 Tax=Trichocoleus sp. FACHB-591 TaxID=2692872 RepID=UPI00168847DE|nr:DUF4279 domain-containing protein [Trichocoleus sp. FACHB-591]MBD2093546.1 DUF4279 domain-containing protein [Trichocoleus sp. FACHB-591]